MQFKPITTSKKDFDRWADALVATHGAHVTTGLIWMIVMLAQVIAKGLTVPVRSRLMRPSMFWHFLDIVWIGVFTIVYLMGAM